MKAKGGKRGGKSRRKGKERKGREERGSGREGEGCVMAVRAMNAPNVNSNNWLLKVRRRDQYRVPVSLVSCYADAIARSAESCRCLKSSTGRDV